MITQGLETQLGVNDVSRWSELCERIWAASNCSKLSYVNKSSDNLEMIDSQTVSLESGLAKLFEETCRFFTLDALCVLPLRLRMYQAESLLHHR